MSSFENCQVCGAALTRVQRLDIHAEGPPRIFSVTGPVCVGCSEGLAKDALGYLTTSEHLEDGTSVTWRLCIPDHIDEVYLDEVYLAKTIATGKLTVKLN